MGPRLVQSDLAMAEATAPAANYTASRLVRDLHAVPRYDWHVSTRVAHVSPSGETVGDVGSSSSPVHAKGKLVKLRTVEVWWKSGLGGCARADCARADRPLAAGYTHANPDAPRSLTPGS